MSDLISREALIKELETFDEELELQIDEVYALIAKAPTIEADSGEAVYQVFWGSDWIEVTKNVYKEKHKSMKHRILYNSPPKQIPDGWKPLSNEQIAEVRESMITDGCLDTVEFANAIYTKLKHINAAPTTSITSETNTEVGE